MGRKYYSMCNCKPKGRNRKNQKNTNKGAATLACSSKYRIVEEDENNCCIHCGFHVHYRTLKHLDDDMYAFLNKQKDSIYEYEPKSINPENSLLSIVPGSPNKPWNQG